MPAPPPPPAAAAERIAVQDPAGAPLAPCHPARARALVRRGRAVWVTRRPACLRLLPGPPEPP